MTPHHLEPVLGFWDGHDAGAALVVDGRILVAVSEERLSRQKRASGFPSLAIAACLEHAGLATEDVGDVATAGRFGRLGHRFLDRVYRRRDPSRDPLSLTSRLVRELEVQLAFTPGLRHLESLSMRAVLVRRLATLGFGHARFHVVDHHTAHALTARAALLGDGIDCQQADVATMDGYGDGVAARFESPARPAVILPSPGASLALVYGATTRLLGFGEGDEGKVMGLAAQGNPERLAPLFRRWTEPGRCCPTLGGQDERRRLAGEAREDVAAALQLVTEERAVALIEHNLPSRRALGLSGGLFANIAVNRAVARGRQHTAVFPHMGDGGLCVGAALAVTGPLPMPLPFLGPTWSDHQIASAIAASGLTASRSGDPDAALADAILAGQLVARVVGRSEFGPRALGHRSILARADDHARLERLNAALGRDDFMPFAPVRRHGAGSKAMTTLVTADADLREHCPAVVHVDGTVRTQLASPDDSELWALLERTEAGGLPALVNTSFNLHGEPIVESPTDALQTFLAAGLDVMRLGSYLVQRMGLAA